MSPPSIEQDSTLPAGGLAEADAWAGRLEEVGRAVRRRVLAALRSGRDDLARPVAHEGGDVVYAIDRHVESVVVEAVEAWPEACQPLLLVAEGLGADGRRRFGDPASPLRYRLIVDPIDGTRGIMYDKRAGWFLAAVAVDRGEQTSLADTFAAVMVELPTSKQGWADTYWAIAGRQAEGRRVRLADDEPLPLPPSPSTADTLEGGFAHVVNFFPGTKQLAAELMERIVAETLGPVRPGEASVFDDQYITSGGQMVELLAGHDRFCADLRPLLSEILHGHGGSTTGGLQCHPYDAAGALVARQSGVILTDGFGRPLDAPLDVFHPVHWCGYANETLRRQIEPVIQAWLAEKGLAPMQ